MNFSLKRLSFLLSLLILGVNSYSQSEYFNKIQAERDTINNQILGREGILNSVEKEEIERLDYFSIDSSWVLTGKFQKKKGKPFLMPTTTSRTPRYRRIGYLHFERQGEKFSLTCYQNMDFKDKEFKNYVFIPFKDGNAPELTYGGGRYLDTEFSLKTKEVVIDFNRAYNPYCVYSHRYSCPITPTENHVEIKINAGVKNPVLR